MARRQLLVLACGPGAVLSHGSAAALWHLLPSLPRDITVTVAARDCRGTDGIKVHRLPPPECNVVIEGLEVDFLWRSARLIVEIDGFAHHSSRLAFERDRLRDARLAAAGYRVIRVTWRQILSRPQKLIARVATAARA